MDHCKIWATVLMLSEEELANEQSKVCSKHFVPSDYISPGLNETHLSLKPTAIPSQNLNKSTQNRASPSKKRKLENEQFSNDKALLQECYMENFNEKLDFNTSVQQEQDDSLNSNEVEDFVIANDVIHEIKNTEDIGTQVSINKHSLVDPKSKLFTLANLYTFKILNELLYLYRTNYPVKKKHQLKRK